MLFYRKMIHRSQLSKQQRMTSLISLLPSPSINDRRENPFSQGGQDIHQAKQGALEHSQLIFLEGTKIPELFQQEHQPQVLELGFGLGLNFINTWKSWNKVTSHGKLHYVAIEKHPRTTEQLTQFWAQYPENRAFSDALIEQWPPATSGIHLLHWSKPELTLTLFFGDVLDALSQLQLAAHAVYFNNVAHPTNPETWFQNVVLLLSRQCRWGCRLVAGSEANFLKAALEYNGFLVCLNPELDPKKDRLEAVFEGIPEGRFRQLNTHQRNPILYRQQNPINDRHALVIGAGIAGCFTAYHLAQSGWRVSLVERHREPASEASSNPCAVIRPHLTQDDNLVSHLTRCGFFEVLNTLKNLNKPVGYQNTGILWLCDSKAEQERHQNLYQNAVYPSELLEWISAEEVFIRFAIPNSYGGIYTSQGGNIHVPTLCQTLIDSCAPEQLQFIQEDSDAASYTKGQWSLFSRTGVTIAQAPVLIMALGMNRSIKGLPELALTPYRGQLLCVNGNQLNSNFPSVCSHGYATQRKDHLWIGATFKNTDEQGYSSQDEQELLSWLTQKNIPVDPFPEKHWVGVRATTPDRFPRIGCVDHQQSLYALMGLGSRGLTLSSLGARYLTSLLNGSPSPLEKRLASHLSPSHHV